ncbi:hypothetical protein CLOM_g21358 [Closterium sp. NIES-68]|nr:hypothetical protein CLOM_g21358 [Closterium sp. NIES-68]
MCICHWYSDIAYQKGSTKIWVPNYPPLRQLLLEEYHDVLYAGHFGSNKTLTGIAKHYYWPHLAEDVQKFVTSCDTCQRMKSSKQRKVRLLQPLPVPEQPGQVVSPEFVTELPPTTSGHDAILVVIDKFSKMGHFIPTHTTARTDETTQLFQVLEGTHVSTRDQTRHVIHLRSADRRTDRAPQPDSRATPPSSLQGRDLQIGLAPARSRVCVQQRYTCRYWTNAVLPLLRTPPTHPTETDNIRYRDQKIHNAFHVQLLKPYWDPNTIFVGRQPPPPPPPVLVQNEPEYKVESVLAHRRRRNGTMELLIRWKGYDPFEDSWVPETDMGNARRPLHDYLQAPINSRRIYLADPGTRAQDFKPKGRG